MFMFKRLRKKHAAIAMLVGVALTLAFDVMHARGVAGSMPYVVLPLLGLLARSSKIVLWTAAVGTVLTLLGLVLSAPGSDFSVVATNRVMSIALIWVVAHLALRHLAIGRRFRKRLRDQALTDSLTGLFNRRHVFACIDNELSRYKRYATKFSIILIDADHFKHVNDNYGHCTGDATLRLIARVCSSAVRKTDVVGRFGGEEFIVVLPQTSAAAAAVVAERIRSGIGTVSSELLDGAVHVTLSLGVAEVGSGKDDFNKLLAAADKALYEAKNAGRDRVAIESEPRPIVQRASAA